MKQINLVVCTLAVLLVVSYIADARPGKGGKWGHGKGGHGKGGHGKGGKHDKFNKYNATCTTDDNCNRRGKNGLVCTSGFCLCSDGSNWVSKDVTFGSKTKTVSYCDIPYDGTCTVHTLPNGETAHKCRDGLICDSASLKCACETGSWDGSACGMLNNN
ncbi:hypothetical protein BpHYR1_008915 [Brachionus plicatilis]|uniref:EGF-like domain-containing protein n=1 Tax=Brachionus plicatilis TaxID=10195 RepID=A0A3M7RKL0_BRAPC|nr:hypothetical protein BpHYR1_008915 [Brachionus plicatilis]